MRKMRMVLGLLGILLGVGLFFYPELHSGYARYQSIGTIREFRENRMRKTEEQSICGENTKTPVLQRMPSPGECLGYIEIPAMELAIPLYYGTADAELARGAGVLEGSSLPVGGIGQNCVIAGHRGYRGIPYFREIERLQPGDRVYVTNEFETLNYCVSSMAVIEPTDREAVEAQEGRDLLTLMTCHPYRSHGRYRYLVYCEREVFPENPTDETGKESAVDSVDQTENPTTESRESVEAGGIFWESSAEEIERERQFRILCGVGILGMVSVMCFRRMNEKK